MDINKDVFKQIHSSVKEALKYPDYEFELKYNARCSRDAFARVVTYCRAQGFSQNDHPESLDIFFVHKGSQYRLTIEGKDIIQKYCVSNRIHNTKNVKEIISKKIVQGFRAVLVEDYALKADLKNEVKVTDEIMMNELLLVLETSLKGFRMKKRYSFTPSHGKWRYDLSVVKRSQNVDDTFIGHKRFSNTLISSTTETYEIEIELLKGEKHDSDKLTKELLKAGVTVYAVANGIENLMSRSEKNRVLESYVSLCKPPAPSIANILQKPKSYFVGPQPVTLEVRNMVSNDDALGFDTVLKDYTVTEKADGERYLMYVDTDGKCYLLNNKLDVFDLKTKISGVSGCVFDGEYITRDSEGKPLRIFAMFDVYFYDKKNTQSLPLVSAASTDSRVKLMQQFITSSNDSFGKAGLTLHVKEFHYDDVSIFPAVQKVLDMVKANNYVYRIDGLIFTPKSLPVGALYQSADPGIQGPWLKLFKWKPSSENTIDMQVVSEKRVTMVDGNVLNVYTLNIGYKPSQWEPIKPKVYLEKGMRTDSTRYTIIPFRPDGVLDRDICLFYGDVCKNGDVIMNNSIIEFAYIKDESLPFPRRWVPLRIRKDKTSPNDYSTAMNVWRSIDYPVTEDMITGKHQVTSSNIPNDDVYYRRQVDRDKFASRNMMTFHNYWAKNQFLIRKYAQGKSSLLDIACGKGGDLKRWIDCGLETVFGIDKVRDNIENPNDGIYARLHQQRNHVDSKKYMFCTMDASQDLSDAYVRSLNEDDKFVGLKLLEHGKFDVVSCQFALHYFFEDEVTLDALLKNVDKFLAPGGYFIGTCLNGAKVEKAMGKNPAISGTVDDRIIWNIRKEYDTKQDYGSEIKVYMESIGMEMSEYLVDKDILSQKVQKLGYSVTEISSFEDVYKSVVSQPASSPEYYYKAVTDMQPVEKEYSFMNMLFVFQKPAISSNTPPKKKVVKKKQPQTT